MTRFKADYFSILIGAILIGFGTGSFRIGIGVWFVAVALLRYQDEYR